MRSGPDGLAREKLSKNSRQRPESLCRLNDAKLPFDGLTCVNEISGRVTGLIPSARTSGRQEALTSTESQFGRCDCRLSCGQRDRQQARTHACRLGRTQGVARSQRNLRLSAHGDFPGQKHHQLPGIDLPAPESIGWRRWREQCFAMQIDENIAEIERSTDFLNRLGLSPQETISCDNGRVSEALFKHIVAR